MPQPELYQHISRERLQQLTFFEGIGETPLDAFAHAAQIQQFPKDALLCIGEDQGETFFVLLDGFCKVSLKRPETHQPINLIVFKPGDFFGELALLEQAQQRSATVETLSPTTTLVVRKEAFLQLLLAYPELSLNLARGLGLRIRLMNERMVALTLPEHTRVARTLMLLAGKPAIEPEKVVTLPPLSPAEWAMFCHLPQDAFERVINDFSRAGITTWDAVEHTLTLCDLIQLKHVACKA